jgi:hypothetical protein
MALQEYVQSIVERAAQPSAQKTISAEPPGREEAVNRMIEFGDKYHLSLGEPITRELLHEGHRYRWSGLSSMPPWQFHGIFRALRPRTRPGDLGIRDCQQHLRFVQQTQENY